METFKIKFKMYKQLTLFNEEQTKINWRSAREKEKGIKQSWDLYDPHNMAWKTHYDDKHNPGRLCPVYIFSKLKII